MSSNDGQAEADLRAAERFLSACRFLLRLRRSLSLLCTVLLITGVAFAAMRIVSSLKAAPDLTVWLFLLPVVALFPLLIPVPPGEVETELDRRLGSGSLFCAFTQSRAKPGRFTLLIAQLTADRISTASPLRAMQVIPLQRLPLALMGGLLMLASLLLPGHPPRRADLVIEAILRDYRPALNAPAAFTSQDPELEKIIRDNLREIVNSIDKGDLVEAALRAREAAAEVADPEPGAPQTEAVLIEAGFDPETARALATGEGSQTGTAATADALKSAADKLGGGARSASLAEAAARIAAGEAVEAALRDALAVARRLSAMERSRREALDTIRELGKRVFEAMDDEQKARLLAGIGEPGVNPFPDPEPALAAGPALDMSQLKQRVIASGSYPLAYLTTMMAYYSLFEKDKDGPR